MKTKIYSLAILTATALSLGSCADNWNGGEPSGNDFGQLSKHSIDVVNGENIISTASRAGYDISNFIVTIRNSAGAQVGQWRYAEMPELVTLPVANGYTVDAYSHVQEKAAWDAPYFESQPVTFNITKDKITEVETVKCKLANIKVTIKYSDDLRRALGSDCKVTVIANDEGSLEFLPDETRAGYFQAIAGSTTLVATLSGTIDGSYAEVRTILNDVAAGHHRIITYSFAGGDPTPPDENGFFDPSTGIQISFDTVNETVEGGVDAEEDNVSGTRPGQEEPEQPEDPGEDDPNNPDNPDDPAEEAATFEATDSPNLKLDEVNVASADFGNAKVNITAPKGFKNLEVTIQTDSPLFEQILDEMNLKHFDLAEPGDAEDSLVSLELPIKDQVVGHTEVLFDITSFIPLLVYPGNHDFVIKVTDSQNNVSSMTLKFVTY